MNENDIFWYKHNCSHCGKVETGFYAKPHVNATFTCRCGRDLVVIDVDHDKNEIICDDLNDALSAAYYSYRNDF